ncbi:hypothetical protein J7394_14845 [Ruegeria sp. R13_0]|uniref:hypothetical protein n=1 Tax=Ruegeria sp. R13_0 TaxID=2821099 RepID=UPI001ADB388F|nr:hypothetical protein [Ruegeria sp. R13_0]MBO9435494.1 hypothetical protein [Ruegeria sp. R13_0]
MSFNSLLRRFSKLRDQVQPVTVDTTMERPTKHPRTSRSEYSDLFKDELATRQTGGLGKAKDGTSPVD